MALPDGLDGPESIVVDLAYSTDLFESDTAERVIDYFITLLEHATVEPTARVRDLQMMSAARLPQFRQTTQSALGAEGEPVAMRAIVFATPKRAPASQCLPLVGNCRERHVRRSGSGDVT